MMYVFIVASGHAPPPFEPADAPFHGVARLVPFRFVRLGVQASVPGRKDGFDAPLREPGAEGVAVIGPVRDQAGQGRAGSGLSQGPGLDTVVALAAGHASRAEVGDGPVDPPKIWIGVLQPPRLRPAREQIRIGLQVGHQARPGTLIA